MIKLYPHQEEAVDFFKRKKNGLLGDEMGCVSGDMIIRVRYEGMIETAIMQIRDFHWNWHSPRKSLKDKYVYSIAEDGTFYKSSVVNVLYKGIKSVISIKYFDEFNFRHPEDNVLTVTRDHRVMIKKGKTFKWVEAKDIKVGDRLVAETPPNSGRGITRAKNLEKKNICNTCGRRRKLAPTIYQGKIVISKGERRCAMCKARSKDKTGKIWRYKDTTGRIRIVGLPESTYPKPKNVPYVFEHQLVMFQKTGRVTTFKENIKHINGNVSDNRPENLEYVPKIVYLEPKKHIQKEKHHTTRKVLEVINEGETIDVYDLVLDSVNHNFTANGVVVHNCGKSISSIAFCEEMFKEGSLDNVLIVVPASLRKQWLQEIVKSVNKEVVVAMGTEKGIKGKSVKKKCYKTLKGKHEIFNAMVNNQYNVVSYDFITNNNQSIQNLLAHKGKRWCVVCDEITKIKNFKVERSKAIKKLHPVYRVGLSGTLIENRAEEAFSIIQWINPKEFRNFKEFDTNYIVRDYWGAITGYKNLNDLRRRLHPYLLRRTKKDIKGLPEVVEQNRMVAFSSYESKLYNRVVDDIMEEYENMMLHNHKRKYVDLSEFEDEQDMGSMAGLMTRMTVLRQICCDARVLTSRFCHSEYAQTLKESVRAQKSSKLEELEEIVEEIVGAGNKVIVFSTYVGVLSMIEEVLKKKGIKFGRVHSTFDEGYMLKEGKVQVGLFSDKGAYGLDYPEVNYIINMDIPFNPAVLAQRNARIQRLSSKFKNITVINLIVEGSIEERIMDIVENKTSFSAEVLDNKDSIKNLFNFTYGSLKKFLEYHRER